MSRVRLLGVVATLVAAAALRAHDTRPEPLPRRSAVTYDLTLWHGAPYVDLDIGSARGRFLFDTGANTSGIDAAWLGSSGVTSRRGGGTTLGGTTGNLSLPTAVLDRVDIGHGFFASPVFGLQDFSHFERPGAVPQAGLLGTDFISAYVTTLDLERGKLTLALPDERLPTDPRDATLRLEYPYNLPTTNVQLGSLTVPCRLDTGAAYFDPRPLLDTNQATIAALTSAGFALRQTGSVAVAGVAGPEWLPLLEGAPPLAFGPTTIANVVLVVHRQGTLATTTPLALASAPLLQRLGRITLDPFNRALRLARR